jgi:hypothetical protein
MLRAVEFGPARVLLVPGRHGTVGEYFSVAFFVLSKQAGSEVITAPVSLAEIGLDSQFHQGIPLRWAVAAASVADLALRVADLALRVADEPEHGNA